MTGAVALAEFIADSLQLLRIDLRDNEIKTGGLMALSHALRVNTSVTRIDLDKETKKESVSFEFIFWQISAFYLGVSVVVVFFLLLIKFMVVLKHCCEI